MLNKVTGKKLSNYRLKDFMTLYLLIYNQLIIIHLKKEKTHAA
jgi:hypothetical protein